MREIILTRQQSLTETLRMLNKAMLVLEKKSSYDKKQFLAEFIKAFSADAKSVWKLLSKIAQKFADPRQPDLADPTTILRDYKLVPYIGSINHGVMFCEGIVIGIQVQLTENTLVSYRLDYAPDKHLHFNFEIYDGQEKYPLAIPLRFSTGRFGFSLLDLNSCDKNEQKTNTLLEAIKLKFWLKMTIAHTLITKPPHETDNSKKPAQQLFEFVRGGTQYDFATVKDHIISCLPKDTGKMRISACQTERALLECLIQSPGIRAKVRNSIFITITEQDESARILEKQHYLTEVDINDSEKRIDSEQPPMQINYGRIRR